MKWKRASIESYDLKVEMVGGERWGLGTWEIQVRDGELTNALPSAEGNFGDRESIRAFGESLRVEKLFDRVTDGCNRAGPDTEVTAEFHPELGYPTKYSFDVPNVVDEEDLVDVLSFEA